MIKVLSVIFLLLNGCASLTLGTSEITGISLFHDRRSLENIASDEQIETAITFKLLTDGAVWELTHFNVTVFNGLVLITGEAPSHQIRHKMNTIARTVAGVRLLQNHMILAHPSSFANRSRDSFITTKVKLKFSESANMPGFDTTRIKVVTENAHVFLMGLVYKKEAYIAAENTRRISGVQQVIKVFEYL
jgi:osmotically-inducible protein OsmY